MMVNHRGAEVSSSVMLPSQTLDSNLPSGAVSSSIGLRWLYSNQRQKIIPKIAIVVIQIDQPTLSKSLIGPPYLAFLVCFVRQIKGQHRRLFIGISMDLRPCPDNDYKKSNHA